MGRSHRGRDGPRDGGGVWGGGGRSSGYNEHRSVSPSRPGGGYYPAPSGGAPPHHRDVTPEGSRRGSGAYTSTPPLMPMPLPGGGMNGGGGGRSRARGGGGGGGFDGGDVTDQLHQLREREMLLQSQLESKNILLDERHDEIASLKEYCDTLSRTLRSKDDESELLQQAMERINAAHSQTVGGRAPHELAEEVQRLESMLRTSHNQGKNLYGDYKKLLQDYDEVEAQLQEARVRVDMLQQEKQDLLGLHCNPHHSHQHQHPQQNQQQQQQQPLSHRGGITTPASGVEPPPPPPPPQQQQQQQQQPQHPPSSADEQAVGPGALLTFSPPGAKKTSVPPPPLAGREARERKKQQQARERAEKDEKARAAAAAEDEAARQLRESHGRAMQEVAAVTDRLRAAKRENEALQRRLEESEAQRQQAPAVRSASSATAATTGTLTTLSATDAAGGGAAVNLEGVLRMERENQLLTEEVVGLRRRLRDTRAASVSPVPSASAAAPPAVPAALVARLAELEAAAEAAAKERDHLRAAAAAGGEVSSLLARVVGLEAKLAEVQGENVALRQQQQQQQPSAEDGRRAQALHGRIRQLEEHLTMVAAEARGLREHEAASGPLMDRIAGLEGLLEDTEEGLMENYRAVLAENEALRAAAAAGEKKGGDPAGLLAGYEALVRENQALKREASSRSASGSGGGGGEVNGALLERNRQLVEENAALRTDVAALKDVQDSVVKADTEAAVAAQDRKALLDEVLRLRELLVCEYLYSLGACCVHVMDALLHTDLFCHLRTKRSLPKTSLCFAGSCSLDRCVEDRGREGQTLAKRMKTKKITHDTPTLHYPQDEIRALEDSINALKADMAVCLPPPPPVISHLPTPQLPSTPHPPRHIQEANKPDRHVRDMQVLYGKVQEFKDTEDSLARALVCLRTSAATSHSHSHTHTHTHTHFPTQDENELLRGYTRDATNDLHARLGALHAESFELKKQLQRTDDAAPVLIEEDKQMFSNEVHRPPPPSSPVAHHASHPRHPHTASQDQRPDL